MFGTLATDASGNGAEKGALVVGESLVVRGAREHNLKDVSLDLPGMH